MRIPLGGALVLAVMLLAAVSSPTASAIGTPADDATACEWPMWGHGPDRTFAYPCPTDISTETVADLRQIWFFRARDTVTATPAVVGGAVYVGDWSGNFYALRAKDGTPRWRFRAEPHSRVYAGQIVSSAAVATVGGVRTVYFASGKTLYALRTRDGRVRWRHEIGRTGPGKRDDPSEIESSPVVTDGMVIIGTDVRNSDQGEEAQVIALDARTGRTRWATTTAPTIGARATGPGCADVWGSPSVDLAARAVFVGTGNCVTSPTGWGPLSEAIVALDLDSGAVRWTYQPHAPNNDDFDFAGAPNLFEIAGRPVVGLGNKDAAYYVVDRATGALVWSTQATTPGIDEPGSNYSYGGFIGPATSSNGRIVGGTAVGGTPALHAFDAATGAIVWQQPAAGPTYAAAAAANGVVFLGGTDFTLRALDLTDGTVLWKHTMSGAVAGGAAVVGDDVFAVAGLREPGPGKRSRTSGVYRFSLSGTPVASTSTTRSSGTATTGPPPPSPSECVDAPCAVPFQLKAPPTGTQPSLTLSVRVEPWRLQVETEGLGDPAAWLRPGSDSAKVGATRYGVFMSERDDNPSGGLVCVLDPDGDCTTTKIPKARATYNRITVLAITGSSKLPAPAEGLDRMVTTQSFVPPLLPRR
ncbi:MAG: outer membrane protein assembly factor BamB family protein [Acidimicrobiia bacterium]